MEGSRCQDSHDRYADGPSVVHLRHSEGGLPAAPPPSPGDAREPQEEAPVETTGQSAVGELRPPALGAKISLTPPPQNLCTPVFSLPTYLLLHVNVYGRRY